MEDRLRMIWGMIALLILLYIRPQVASLFRYIFYGPR